MQQIFSQADTTAPLFFPDSMQDLTCSWIALSSCTIAATAQKSARDKWRRT
jgi:hypothetical protein